MMSIELLDGLVEFGALLSLYQQLSNLRTALQVLRPHFPDFPLLRPFPLLVQRPKSVLGELPLVLVEGSLGLGVPDLPFIVWEILPS